MIEVKKLQTSVKELDQVVSRLEQSPGPLELRGLAEKAKIAVGHIREATERAAEAQRVAQD